MIKQIGRYVGFLSLVALVVPTAQAGFTWDFRDVSIAADNTILAQNFAWPDTTSTQTATLTGFDSGSTSLVQHQPQKNFAGIGVNGPPDAGRIGRDPSNGRFETLTATLSVSGLISGILFETNNSPQSATVRITVGATVTQVTIAGTGGAGNFFPVFHLGNGNTVLVEVLSGGTRLTGLSVNTPEPGTLVLILGAAVGLAAWRVRQRSA